MEVLALGTGPTGMLTGAALAEPRIDEHGGAYYAMTALPSCLEPAEPLARGLRDGVAGAVRRRAGSGMSSSR
ncbi:MAG TPA: hypothetical protein VFT70_01475 [Nocardioides sp.]|nr:hypothetical protein [Nocardioides sp.]